jgi:L-arabinose isomerase
VHNTDLLDPLPDEVGAHAVRSHSILFSHCGSGGFTLAARRAAITLAPVRLMERGCCVRFPARAGPVTLVNSVPTLSGYRLAVLYGQAVETEMLFPGNPLCVRFQSDYQTLLAWIAAEGLGHHWMAAYGDLRRPLRDLCALAGCAWLEAP